jgi:4'-phosphopantetheinyl transferase
MVYIDDHINDFDLQAALATISVQRREQALKFKFEQGQRTCVLADLLLKRALREEYGLTENPVFDYGEHGKPFIVGHPDIHFNLSHCREAVACVVADHPVGIDVESVRDYKDGVVEYTMNPQELALIAAAERPDAAFVRLWTMKEARLKLTGEGITNDIKQALADSHRYRFTTVERLDHNYIYTVCEERALKVEG